MTKSARLDGKLALVTGGGRGIGRALALAMAEAGSDVALLAQTAAELERTAGEIRTLGRRALAFAGDVSNPEHVEKLHRAVTNEWGDVDILINNAGIQSPIGPLVQNEPAQWLRTVHVNLFGPFLCMRAVLPGMLNRRYGKIINLSGGGAAGSRPNFSAYAASKAAVVRLTETVADEVRDFNVQVNAIAPGAINTRMLDELILAGDAAGERALSGARQQKRDGGDSLAAVIELALFLASGDSGALTGKLISAQHDPWRDWAEHTSELNAIALYTLRRLDPHTIKPFLTGSQLR